MNHGNTGYTNGCRCGECRTARRIYAIGRDRDIRRGLARTVSAKPARAHIALLRRAGMTVAEVAARARVSPDTISEVSNGQERLYRRNADAILAVPLGVAA